MKKGQTGIHFDADGTLVRDAKVVRLRGGNMVDLDAEGEHVQMVPIGKGPGTFEPHGYDVEDAPPPAPLARLVPRYVPVWHVYAVALPLAAGVSVVVNLLMNWLGGP